ncbi:MAG: alkaline phosphatase [Betaproteobacteria bacterium]
MTTFHPVPVLVGAMIISTTALAADLSPEEWYAAGAAAVVRNAQIRPVSGHARNVILFIGDGMGITTITAARILDGQRKGGSGEDNALSFEAFPNVALSKTYSANQQTPDSAPTMSAMVTGVKTGDGLISVTDRVPRREAHGEVVRAGALRTILEWAEDRALSTGVVTTTRITHATPAACYAHSAERDWEGDADLPAGATTPDIARQLLDFQHGNGLEVALGGGRAKFYTVDEADPEYPGRAGSRMDGRRLWREWTANNPRSVYVWNKAQFDAVDPATTDHLLGLFEPSHMKYEADRAQDAAGEPSLAEMTAKAVAILSKNPKGYFLMVEGGRIDHAHHASNAYRALTDAIALSEAVARAVDATDANDTLIIVTADHSHVFTMAGYPKRGNPILGKVVSPGHEARDYARDLAGRPYTTLGYANGPGYTGASDKQPAGSKRFEHMPAKVEPAVGRPDLTNVDTTAPGYLQESTVPAPSETHGGEDVAIFATGPGAQLVRGVMEQNAIFHVMREAFGWK